MSDSPSRPRRAGDRATIARATAYERWELPNVDVVGPVTVEQLQSVQDAAYREAYAAGQDKGYQEGYERGREAGEQTLHEQIERFRALVAALAEPLECLDEEMEQTLVDLSMAVARQLVYGELHQNPERILDAVRQALSVLPLANRDARIYLSPRDMEPVREALSAQANDRACTLVEDPSLEPGGCRVESADSRVDASVRTRLLSVVAQVLGGESLSATDSGDAAPGGTEEAMERIKRIFDSDDA